MTTALANTSIPYLPFIFLVRMFKMYSLSNMKACDTVLLAVKSSEITKNQWITEIVISKSLLCKHQNDSLQTRSAQPKIWNEAQEGIVIK